MFKQAVKSQSKLRMTIDGPAGSGKTYTALRFAHAIARQAGGKIAVIDTERGSASKYVGESPDGYPWQFDVLELTTFSPEKYTEAVIAAGRAGYAVLVIDSLSHAWEGTGGALEIKDRVSSASSENSYTAWRHVTPLHNRMIDTILQAPMHVITTMRSRTEYVPEAGPNGKITNIRRVGLAPVQRPGMEYEFDLVCDMDWSHIMTVGKSRCSAVADARLEKPGAEFVAALLDWLSGAAVEPAQFAPATPAAPVEAAPVAAAEENVWTLEKLLTLYSPDLIMQANEGKIPATQEEINTVAMFLAQ
jgi:hypothetical protein